MTKDLKWYEEWDDSTKKVRPNTDAILKRSIFGILITFTLITTSVFLISYWGHPNIIPANEIGDSFGVANSIFSSLAFALLIYTSMLQRQELKFQREELELTRNELARTADAQEKSEKALHEQSEILGKTLAYNAFESFTTEYAQPAMSQSVKDLWDFKRKHKAEVETAYINQFLLDHVEKELAQFSTVEEAFTIHNQRRLVSQFYHRVQSFIDEEIFPKEIFYIYWSKRDLEIIPQVLIPMEIAVGKIINGPDYQLDMSNSSLQKLYENSPSN